MDRFMADTPQLGDVRADELSFGVETFALGNRIENPEVRRGVSARRCRPLPAAVVAREEAINKVLHEELFAQTPIEE